MTYPELKVLAREYVQLCLDEVKDEAYDYARDELELNDAESEQLSDIVLRAEARIP